VTPKAQGLDLAAGISIPLDLVTQRAAILGRTGSGKTYTLRKIVELLVGAGLPVVVLDPMGAFYGLRASADGKREGIPVTILGGEHGDIPLESTAGAVVADLVVDHPGAYIIDLSSFDTDAEEDRFAEAFAYRLFRAKAKNKTAMCLIVDEADRFAPQRPYKGQERMLGAFNTLSRRARQRGLGLILATQRPASLNKHVLTQAELLVVHQITGPQDRDAVDEWVTMHGTKEQRKEFLESLSKLERGEAYLWSPSWLQIFQRVRIAKTTTFDSSKTPEPGDVPVEPKKLAPVQLEVLRKKMVSTIEKAKADDPREWKKKVAERDRRIRELETEMQEKGRSLEHAAAHVREVERTVEVKVPILDAKLVAHLDRQTVSAVKNAEKAAAQLGSILSDIGARLEEARSLTGQRPKGGTHADRVLTQTSPRPAPGVVASPKPAVPARERVADPAAPAASNGDLRLSGSQQAILDALAWLDSIARNKPTRNAVALVAKVSSKSSGFDKNLSTLKTAGLVSYPGPGLLYLTNDGRAHARVPERPPTQEEMQEAVYARLSSSQTAILRALVEIWPDSADRELLAERVKVSPASSGYDKNLSTLRTLGLVDYPQRGYVEATDAMFLGGGV
jgi:Mn-dependent DtxR family transcriptional regulator